MLRRSIRISLQNSIFMWICHVFSPDEEEFDDSEDGYLCEPCDRAFDDEEGFQRHMQEHQTCGIDGCKFNAHELLVMAHIKMQHSSGLYDKIRNISTPEDIEKWRAERRKKYPSKANIEQRYKQQEEMLKRGERIGPNKDRFGRTKSAIVAKREKLKMKKKRRKAHVKKTAEEPVSLIDEKADWNGDMFPFRGTAFLQEEETSEDETKEAFSDDEWGQDECENVDEPVLNNALGALIGAYQSDESDDEQVQTKRTNNKPVPNNIATNNVPTIGTIINPTEVDLETNTAPDAEEDNISEVKILKEPVDIPDKATEMKNAAKKRSVPTTVNNVGGKDMPIPPKRIKKTKKEPRPQKMTYSRKPTLLRKLLDKEIRHERNVILQCVRFVINNNFFDIPKNNSDPISSTNSTCQESQEQQCSETNTDNPVVLKTEADNE